MVKMIEDLRFNYCGLISNGNNTVTDFMYGGDILDASKMIKTKFGYSFIDILHSVEKLNIDYEFNTFLNETKEFNYE
jgi:hypothetical protein